MREYSDADTIVKNNTQTSRFSLGPWALLLTVIALAFILLGFGIACAGLYYAYDFAATPDNIKTVFNYLVGEERFYVQWMIGKELKSIQVDSSVRLLVAAIAFSLVLSPIYAFISALVKAGTGILSFLKDYEKSLH